MIASFTNEQWNVYLGKYDERWIFFISLFIVHESIWTVLNGFYWACDSFQWLKVWKIERKGITTQSPPFSLVMTSIKTQLISHFTTQPIALYALFPLAYSFGTRSLGPIPSIFTIVWQVTFAAAVNDALFYVFHVLLHWGPLYARIHKQHHEFRATTGFAAEYAHPIESIVGNTLPTIIVPVLLGFHTQVFVLWLAFRLIRTYGESGPHSRE